MTALAAGLAAELRFILEASIQPVRARVIRPQPPIRAVSGHGFRLWKDFEKASKQGYCFEEKRDQPGKALEHCLGFFSIKKAR